MGNYDENVGVYYDREGNKCHADLNKLNYGVCWSQPKGSTLPGLPNGMYWKPINPNFGRMENDTDYWELSKTPTPNLREENDKLQLVIKEKDRELHKMHRDFDEIRQAGLEQNKKLQEQADKFRNMYHETKQELKETLEYANRFSQETDKECGMAEQSPEDKAYEDIHTKRMSAEIESIKLDNQLKKDRLQFRKDYPEGVWERLDVRTKDTLNYIESRTTLIWVAFVTFAVNEVIQWLTR